MNLKYHVTGYESFKNMLLFTKQFNIIQFRKIPDRLDTITVGYTKYLVNSSVNQVVKHRIGGFLWICNL